MAKHPKSTSHLGSSHGNKGGNKGMMSFPERDGAAPKVNVKKIAKEK